ncbi:hypothetical protein QTI66_02390 [Variovorax sp. J22R133]|uniref:hypothetical protein n=1 Tax=Variovorax brevis TaxID=3053503 RepID=UPI0025767A94|nr:hypothetical protein [Variovorax sp. J22R133]MDM0110975.1 hypothetical protein [Variovorax sp. J22R133]
MKRSNAAQSPQPLTPSQIALVLEMLELHQLAPKETAAMFNQVTQAGVFTEAQQDAIEILFSLEEREIPDALFDFADDDARDIVRESLPHEARLSYVRA